MAMGEDVRRVEIRVGGELLSLRVASDRVGQLQQIEQQIGDQIEEAQRKQPNLTLGQAVALLLVRSIIGQSEHRGVQADLKRALEEVREIRGRIAESQ